MNFQGRAPSLTQTAQSHPLDLLNYDPFASVKLEVLDNLKRRLSYAPPGTKQFKVKHGIRISSYEECSRFGYVNKTTKASTYDAVSRLAHLCQKNGFKTTYSFTKVNGTDDESHTWIAHLVVEQSWMGDR